VVEPLLKALVDRAWYRDQVVHVERREATSPRHRLPAAPFPPPIQAMLGERGMTPYTHQAEVVDLCRAGADVLVATRTASGKSLAYNLVVAEALLADPEATALYLFPTKALARDQLLELAALDAALGLHAEPAAYDGDTPRGARSRIRSRSRILVSNPYGLHEYLPQAAALERVLSRLAVVVVDEAHRYRGVFGSHVALVL
jgi:DEAD/DEAH box helicase domain-containing protein